MNIRSISSLFTFAILALTSFAQFYNPVSWEFSSKALGNGEFELQFNAEIEPHWHLYGMNIEEGGPIPTTLYFTEADDYKLIGNAQEPDGITLDDPMFGMELKYFENSAVFTQRVKITGSNATVAGELEFMACDDEKCLPPELVEFNFDLVEKAPKKTPTSEPKGTPEKTVAVETTDKPINPEPEAESSTSNKQDDEPKMYKPVAWSFEVNQIENDNYELIATATIEEGWHVYSTDLPENDGPIPTRIDWKAHQGLKLVGEIEQRGELKDEYDPNFQLDLRYFENSVSFVQVVKLTGEGGIATGELEFMVCNDTRCLLPEIIDLNFQVGDAAAVITAETEESENESRSSDEEKDGSLWAIFVFGFLGGFAALLTPCVFPMIPMTVSFFTKQSKSRAAGVTNAVIYGLFIIGIYTILGYVITKVFGADALNVLSTDPIFNVVFFFLLIIFAISFFGAFEITLPSSWVNNADRASDRGGIIGIFFMALVLSLVSFSCTGPIIGTLLVDAAVFGGVKGPLIGMFGFSLALALPFGLFAAFPGWLNSMPKSGGWLNSVKVVLGFLELALAFKFLSNADLVQQWGILTREIFIAIWIGVFTMLFLYLLGKFRLPHDSPMEKLTVGRMLFATFVGIFIIYLIPGLWGAPLKVISGFPPPMFYSESPNGVGAAAVVPVNASTEEIPEGADPSHCPHNLPCFHDYETALNYAREIGKPLMVDFTGHACVNCRKMEEQVWSDPRVLERLRNDVVLVSLYVDERTKLPESEQYVSETTGKKIKTVGNKWSDFQAEVFKTNAQPHYVFLDHDENQLHESAAYDPDIELFIDWLDRGKKAFKKTK